MHLEHLHLLLVLSVASLPLSSPLLFISLRLRSNLLLLSGQLLLVRPLLLQPLFFKALCFGGSVGSVSLLISRYLLHHCRLSLLLLLHHLLELLLSGLLLLLALLFITFPVFGGSEVQGFHLCLYLCHLCLVPLVTLLLISLTSVQVFSPNPVFSFFLPASLSLVMLPVLLHDPFFGPRGLLRHVFHSLSHLRVHLLLIQRLLLSILTILFHGLHEGQHDRLHL